METRTIPRGLRNNNPCNIRRGSKWVGQLAVQTDKDFCQFQSMMYGWRAALYLIARTYRQRYGLRTIGEIIAKWAPPNENATERYISFVVKEMPGDGDASRPMKPFTQDPLAYMNLVMAMAKYENGVTQLDSEPLFEAAQNLLIEKY